MKRKLTVIVAALLCVLMAVPFAMMTSVADTVEVPAEPTYTGNTVIYVAHDTKSKFTNPLINPTEDGGDTEQNPYKTSVKNGWKNLMEGKAKDGGTIVIVGKGYIGANFAIPKTTAPIVFTSNYNGVDYATYTDENNTIYNDEDKAAGTEGGGQFGSILLGTKCTLTIRGDVILDNVYVFNRGEKVGTFSVEGKLVVKSNVKFHGKSTVIHNLNVAEGGYAYLHTLGFDAYTGTGTIVVGDEIKNTVTKADFAGFEGKIVDKNGNALFANETTETTAGETTETTAGETTETTAGETTETTAGQTTETTAGEDTTAETKKPIEVPAKPTSKNDTVVYTAFGTNLTLGFTPSESGGATADNPFKTNPTTAWGTLFSGAAKDGGTIVMVGKAYFGTDYTIPATTAPLVITSGANKLYASKYQGDDATKPLYDVEKAGQYCTVNNSTDASVAGQFGMFMINQGKKLTIAGEVIFDDAVILNRSQTAVDNPGTFVVTGKLVIKDNVDFVEMGGEVMYHLEVAEGGYVYLDKLGFDAYTGKGTIVVGDEIKNTVTEEDFAGFEGNIVDKYGNAIVFGTTQNPSSNPSTGDMSLVVAVVAALSVAACISVIIVKKTKEN